MTLTEIIDDATGANKRNMARSRPHNGQFHTDDGERGKQEIRGVTMRDVRDCFMRAVALASGPGPLYNQANLGA